MAPLSQHDIDLNLSSTKTGLPIVVIEALQQVTPLLWCSLLQFLCSTFQCLWLVLVPKWASWCQPSHWTCVGWLVNGLPWADSHWRLSLLRSLLHLHLLFVPLCDYHLCSAHQTHSLLQNLNPWIRLNLVHKHNSTSQYTQVTITCVSYKCIWFPLFSVLEKSTPDWWDGAKTVS